MYSSKCSYSIYVKFFGYETCNKLICASGKGCRNKNTISKQGISIINMNMTSLSSTLSFGCSPHKGTCYVFSEYLVPHRLQAH